MHTVSVYLKSGQTIKFTCQEWEFTYSNATLEFTAYKILGAIPKVSIVPNMIAAYTVD